MGHNIPMEQDTPIGLDTLPQGIECFHWGKDKPKRQDIPMRWDTLNTAGYNQGSR
jgi:hypothetical protein